jgi:hypothetical protein
VNVVGAVVAHKDVSVLGGDRHAGRTLKVTVSSTAPSSPNHAHEAAHLGEDLHSVVSVVAHVHLVVGPVHRNAAWTVELPVAITEPTEFTQKKSLLVEHLHTVVVGVDDKHLVVRRHCEAIGAVELPHRDPARPELTQIESIAREDLHTIGLEVRHEDLLLARNVDPDAVLELPLARAAVPPLAHEVAPPVEHLHPMVATVAHEEFVGGGGHGDVVGAVQLTIAITKPTEFTNIYTLPIKNLHNRANMQRESFTC